MLHESARVLQVVPVITICSSTFTIYQDLATVVLSENAFAKCVCDFK